MRLFWKTAGLVVCLLCLLMTLAGCRNNKTEDIENTSVTDETILEQETISPKERDPEEVTEETSEETTEDTTENSLEKLPVPNPFEGADEIKLPDVEVDWGNEEDIEETEHDESTPVEEETLPHPEETVPEETEEVTDENVQTEPSEPETDMEMPDDSIGEDDF